MFYGHFRHHDGSGQLDDQVSLAAIECPTFTRLHTRLSHNNIPSSLHSNSNHITWTVLLQYDMVQQGLTLIFKVQWRQITIQSARMSEIKKCRLDLDGQV